MSEELSEAQFKELRLSIDYRKNKLNKIEARIDALSSGKTQAESAVTAVEEELEVLKDVIDMHNLLREKTNFLKRRERAVERILRVNSDMQGMEQLRNSLNERWTKRGGKELVEPLALLADGQIYVV